MEKCGTLLMAIPDFNHKVCGGRGLEQTQNDNFNVLLLGQTDLTMKNPTEFWE